MSRLWSPKPGSGTRKRSRPASTKYVTGISRATGNDVLDALPVGGKCVSDAIIGWQWCP